jgi:cytochrome o ubiquinol oxidase subunit II
MGKKVRLPLAILLVLGIILAAVLFMPGHNYAVLQPQGSIADKQFHLIVFTSLLSLIVVIPVFALLIGILWRYRASNKKAKYSPDLEGNKTAEAIWWLVPLALMCILGVVTWRSSHELDPYKPIASQNKPLTVQVIALEWKWLFIYPEQNIATVNYLQIPEKTPINFELTADAPMNSFWIPQLGGQVYAMAGMQTKLHLMANGIGEYRGSSANISGEGFSGMKFLTKSTSRPDFDAWVTQAQKSEHPLSKVEYDSLSKQSKDNPPTTYSTTAKGLYDTVMMKYMMP